MEVIYWQLVVVASVAIAYSVLGVRLALLTCIGWTIWTLTSLFYMPLLLIQLVSAWGTFLTCMALGHWQANAIREKQGRKDERRLRKEGEDEIARLQMQLKATLVKWSANDGLQSSVLRLAKVSPQSIEFVDGRQHYDLLITSLAEAQFSIAILSGWIGSPIKAPALRTALQTSLDRGVSIYIGYGHEGPSGHERRPVGDEALAILTSLARQRVSTQGRLRVAQFATHEKTLVVDSKYFVIGSHNWTSNKEFHNAERSILIRESDLVASERERIVALVLQHLSPAFRPPPNSARAGADRPG